MAQFETFAAYFGRLITIEAFIWISFIMLISFLLRKPFSRALGVSINRYLLIALAFGGVLGLSLRFWEVYGTISTFWLFAPELWSAGLQINANLVLNVVLYVPPATLLVLARKRWWESLLALGLLSFLIETLQQYLRFGAGDPFDWFANTFGVLVGIVLGVILLRLFPSLGLPLRK
jgi:glycopeptide antibiotics resistance protein